jgi:hypothetical protein
MASVKKKANYNATLDVSGADLQSIWRARGRMLSKLLARNLVLRTVCLSAVAKDGQTAVNKVPQTVRRRESVRTEGHGCQRNRKRDKYKRIAAMPNYLCESYL